MLLAAAIMTEVAATLALRVAVEGNRRWYAVVVTGYVIAFGCLGGALAQGMPLAIGYGIWAAVGVALTAMLSKVLFDEPLTPVMGLGIVLIAAGVVMIEFGSAAH